MPLFGVHFSVAGGLHKAVAECVTHGCQTVQIFTKNANQWVGKPQTAEEVAAFRTAAAAAGLRYLTAHDSYLINLASPDDALFQKSVAAFVDELSRAEALGLSYLVTHPGSHVGTGDEAGLARVVQGLDEALAKCPGYSVKVLLETTAGQGSALGHRFEHLATIFAGVAEPDRFGVCLDTCHVFAAGYDLRTPEAFAATFAEFDRVVGLSRLKLFHVNDSQKGLGCKVDRHAGLGLGEIGDEAFRLLATDPRFAELPMILETPKEDDAKRPMDAANLAKLRGYKAGESFPPTSSSPADTPTPPVRKPRRAAPQTPSFGFGEGTGA